MYGRIDVRKGDRVFFYGKGFTGMTVGQITLANGRNTEGRDLPAGTLIDYKQDGTPEGIYTPNDQANLAVAREERRKEREAKKQRCGEQCAALYEDFAERTKCENRCMAE
jgi:hypothetical protein